MFDLKAVRILPYKLKISGAKVTELSLFTNNGVKKEKAPDFSSVHLPKLLNVLLTQRFSRSFQPFEGPSASSDQILLLTGSFDRRPIKSFDGSLRPQIEIAFDGSFNLITLSCLTLNYFPNFLHV